MLLFIFLLDVVFFFVFVGIFCFFLFVGEEVIIGEEKLMLGEGNEVF